MHAKYLSQPSPTIRTRDINQEYVKEYKGFIIKHRTINQNIHIIVRNKELWRRFNQIQKGEVDEEIDWQADVIENPALIKETLAGAHSVQSMQDALNEFPERQDIQSLLSSVPITLYVSDDSKDSRVQIIALGHLLNRIDDKRRKLSFRDHLHMLHTIKLAIQDEQGSYVFSELVDRGVAASGYAIPTIRQYVQFVRNDIEFLLIDGLLYDAEKEYKRKTSAKPLPRPATDVPVEKPENPVPQVTANSHLLPILSLEHEDRVAMLRKLMSREITLKQFESECLTAAARI